MLLVTRGHHELDEEKVPDQASLSDIGQVWCTLILRKKQLGVVLSVSLPTLLYA